MIDQSTDFGARVAEHLREGIVVWLTTVSPGGAPLPTPVWFVWDGERTVRIHSLPTARRVEHIAANPRVSLNFDGDGRGGDVVVFSGRATIEPSPTSVHAAAPYVEKYRAQMEGIGLTPEQFAERYPVALTVGLTRVRGH